MPRTSLKTKVEARLSLDVQAKELLDIREQIDRLEKRKRVIADALMAAIIDNDGQPVLTDEYELKPVIPGPRLVLDERRLLENGVKLETIEASKVERPGASPYARVTLRKDV